MELEKATMILSDIVEHYIATYPDRENETLGAIAVISAKAKDSAEILQACGTAMNQAGAVMIVQTAIMMNAVSI